MEKLSAENQQLSQRLQELQTKEEQLKELQQQLEENNKLLQQKDNYINQVKDQLETKEQEIRGELRTRILTRRYILAFLLLLMSLIFHSSYSLNM